MQNPFLIKPIRLFRAIAIKDMFANYTGKQSENDASANTDEQLMEVETGYSEVSPKGH